MVWDYRVVHRVVDGEHLYTIHEVYYDDAGQVSSVTEEEVAPSGETLDDLIADVRVYQAALDQPVLEYTDIVTISEQD